VSSQCDGSAHGKNVPNKHDLTGVPLDVTTSVNLTMLGWLRCLDQARRIVFSFHVLNSLIISECLIARRQRYIPNVARNLLIGAEVVAAGVLILRMVTGRNLAISKR
jgi:hypothetical protein